MRRRPGRIVEAAARGVHVFSARVGWRIIVAVLLAVGFSAALFVTPALATASASCSSSSGTLTVAISNGSASDQLAVTTASGDYSIKLDSNPVCTGVSDATDSAVAVSGTATATFSPGSDSGVTFEGGAGNSNTLDASAAGGTSLTTVAVGQDDSSLPGTITAPSLGDSFTGITAVDGSSGSGGTTFNAGNTSASMAFVGQGIGTNTLNLDALTTSLTVDLDGGTVTGTGGEVASFSGIQHVEGGGMGNTMFETTLASASFQLTGNGQGNTLDLSAAPAAASVTVSSGTGSATGTVSDSFSDMQSFTGSSSGQTIFTVGSGSMSFTGQGSGNELTFAADPAGNEIAENGDGASRPARFKRPMARTRSPGSTRWSARPQARTTSCWVPPAPG